MAGQAQLYLYDDNLKRWIPATTASLGGGGGSTSSGTTGGATAANQAEVISRLNTLLGENATEAEQQDIEAAIVALQNAWLAENATEAKQDALIAKTEELRSLLLDLKNAIAPDTKPTATFTIAGVGTGTIPTGARFATFTIPPGGSGTIAGTTYTDEVQEIPFPAIESGYNAIAYEVTAGNLYITYAI